MAAASPTEFLVRPRKSPTTRGDVSVAASAADVCLATAHVHESRRPPWDDLEVGGGQPGPRERGRASLAQLEEAKDLFDKEYGASGNGSPGAEPAQVR